MSNRCRKVRVEGSIAYVPLTKGYEAIIDSHYADIVGKHSWFVVLSDRNIYAARHITGPNNKIIRIYLHRFIAEAPENKEVDHINHDGLDNRMKNLRLCSRSENSQNQRCQKQKVNGYKGVGWHKHSRKWRAYIRVNGKAKHLGLFSTEYAAASAYNEASRKFFGKYACQNKVDTE